MTNFPFRSIDQFQDIESLNHYAEAVAHGRPPEQVLAGMRAVSRDNARTPMQWNASPQAGFGSDTPWLAVNPNYVEVNAEAARADPDSVFHHYRKLIELRHTEPTVAHGDFTMLLAEHPRIYAFTRKLGETELLVLGNFSSGNEKVPAEGDFDPEAWSSAELLLGNYPPGDWTLRPWEARIYRR